jgi:chemotaxis response regulator CheB
MSTRCLLVFANELMFVAVMSLLKSQPDLELVGVSAPNEQDLFQAIDFYKPDILILDESNSPGQSTRPLRPLLYYPELRVITLNHEDNLLHIYQKRDVMVTRITDLVSVICEPRGA